MNAEPSTFPVVGHRQTTIHNMRAAQAKEAAHFLHLGDSVVLHDGYAEGWVGTTNFSDQTLAVSAQPGIAQIFVIMQQHTCGAAHALKQFLEVQGLTAQEAQREQRCQHFFDSVAREEEVNAHEFDNSKGRELRYGMVIQLKHHLSQRFAQVTTQSAEMNPEGRRVALAEEVSELCWLRIVPRLRRVHSEGERVRVGDPVALELVETSLHLQVATRRPLDDGRYELTTTAAEAWMATAFKLGLYRSHADEARSDAVLHGGMPVRLIHSPAAQISSDLLQPLTEYRRISSNLPSPHISGASLPQGGQRLHGLRPQARRAGAARVHRGARRRALDQLRVAYGQGARVNRLPSPLLFASPSPLFALASLLASSSPLSRPSARLPEPAHRHDGAPVRWSDAVRLRHAIVERCLSVVLPPLAEAPTVIASDCFGCTLLHLMNSPRRQRCSECI